MFPSFVSQTKILMFMEYMLILLFVSIVVSAIGWKYFIYFFSLGYGFSIVALAAAMIVLFPHTASLPSLVLCLVLLAYGCRLGIYLAVREHNSSEYRKILYSKTLQKRKPLWETLFVWLFCALLYVAEISPVAFRLGNESAGLRVYPFWAWAGAVIMICGAALEAVADAQKSAAKKKNHRRFVSTGLYRLVRCPNYLGEVVLWTGCFISGIGASLSVGQWIIAAVGYLGILYVMFSGARRLELRQNAVYGNAPEYQSYVSRTPILVPMLPLYSLARHKFLAA